MSADMLAVARYVEYEAGQLIRKARTERDKAWREVAATHAASRQKDEQIRKLTRELRAAEGLARRARRQLGQLEASYDALLMRHAFENAQTN